MLSNKYDHQTNTVFLTNIITKNPSLFKKHFFYSLKTELFQTFQTSK